MQNPIARWHICEGSVNSIAFSRDGAYIATVGRDGMNVISGFCLVIFIIYLGLFPETSYHSIM